ncbi:MAG: AAA family ATPase [Gammaproteobacteria bacterium]|nr:AAA family ATPase [Gammaproteobacteria bacterium]NNJ49891.1 AAA family ATPase [Gammaproteobacteria bacterium]
MAFDIQNMLTAKVYDHPVSQLDLIETHISWVILTGDFAYKIKKPVDFGFLDFSTLDKRYDCCQQELHLNRRLAPVIYLDIVNITGSSEEPHISASGEAFEYAIKMAQFPQSAQLDNMLAAGDLSAEHIDAFAQMAADFHQSIDVADRSVVYGDNDTVHQPVAENFIQIEEHIDTTAYSLALEHLRQWSQTEFKRLAKDISQRKDNGFIRECHGDMHLRNMIWLNDQPMAFDCIEFNAALRWIDVISEVAFLVMDLQDRQQYRLANRFLNSYLEITGDYAGLSVLPYYLVYRAMVRAKVNALRLEQDNISSDESNEVRQAFESYLALAATYTRQEQPQLIIMRGLSASGKSTISQQLVDSMGAIRIRSDVERKRIFHHERLATAGNEIDQGIYSAQASEQTYSRLQQLASEIIRSGYSVIVDAAFLKHEQRYPFQLLAESLAVRYNILEITAPADTLRQRIIARRNDVSDADLAVLEHQLSHWKPLSEDELRSVMHVNTAEHVALDSLIERIKL